MPKIKTNRAAAKRFEFAKANAGHMMTRKSTKRKRDLRKGHVIAKTDMKELRLLLPNG